MLLCRLALWLAVLTLSKPSGHPHSYASTKVEKVFLVTAEVCAKAQKRRSSLSALPHSCQHYRAMNKPFQVWQAGQGNTQAPF